MKTTFAVAAILFACAVSVAGPAFAQGAPQVIRIERVDVQKLSAGYRATKIIGSSVVNEANDKIGSIEDLLVQSNDRVLYAVLSVGGFIGIGERMVVVPFQALQITDDRILLPGSTKAELMELAEFKYVVK